MGTPDSQSPTDPETAVVLRRVPEFGDRYFSLVAAADGDPGAAVVFEELAAWAGGLLRLSDQAMRLLPTLVAALEEVATTSPDAEELVGGAFLDNLSPDDLRSLSWALGPATRAILDDLELPVEARRLD